MKMKDEDESDGDKNEGEFNIKFLYFTHESQNNLN